MSAGQARHEHGTARLAFDDRRGSILAAALDHVQDVGAYPTPWPVGTGAATGMIFPGPYRVTRGTFSHASVFSNTSGRVAYRGPWSFETLAREVTLDIAARRIGIDPAELRRRNLLSRGRACRSPTPTACRTTTWTSLETLEQALAILDYDAFRAEQAAARASRAATSASASPATPSRPSAGFGYYATEGATIRIEPSGKVNVYVAGGSTGNSLETTVVQLPPTRSGPTSPTCTRSRATPR